MIVGPIKLESVSIVKLAGYPNTLKGYFTMSNDKGYKIAFSVAWHECSHVQDEQADENGDFDLEDIFAHCEGYMESSFFQNKAQMVEKKARYQKEITRFAPEPEIIEEVAEAADVV